MSRPDHANGAPPRISTTERDSDGPRSLSRSSNARRGSACASSAWTASRCSAAVSTSSAAAIAAVPRAATAVRAASGSATNEARVRSAAATSTTNTTDDAANPRRFHARSPRTVRTTLSAVVSAQAINAAAAGARSQTAAVSTVAVAATVHQRPGRGFTDGLYPEKRRRATGEERGAIGRRASLSGLRGDIFIRMRSIPLLALAACLSATARAQVISLDEGSFTITRSGDRVGREDFSIRSSPADGGSVLVAHGVVAMGARRIEPSLNADTSGGVLKYQTEVRESGRAVVTYSGEFARDH